MPQPVPPSYFDLTLTLLHSRHNVLPRRLSEPGPNEQQLAQILGSAAAAPDHKQLQPWRFVIVPSTQREILGDVFAQALQERDPQASPEQVAQAREKAQRAPFLMLAIVRLRPPDLRPSGPVAHAPDDERQVGDAERLVSLGCAIQNILLSAHAAGFGTGLTSGQALSSEPLRQLFHLRAHEQAVCFVSLGTASTRAKERRRPTLGDFVSELRK